jgi:hypothetical protein
MRMLGEWRVRRSSIVLAMMMSKNKVEIDYFSRFANTAGKKFLHDGAAASRPVCRRQPPDENVVVYELTSGVQSRNLSTTRRRGGIAAMMTIQSQPD